MDAAVKIDKQIPEAIINLSNFIEEFNDIKIELFPKIGVWVLWNIAGECPIHKDMESLAPALGSYLSNAVNLFINQ